MLPKIRRDRRVREADRRPLPAGYFRAGARRFSWPWIVAIHAPVPVIIGLRYAAGLGWRLYTFPVLIGAYAMGQFLGSRLRRGREPGRLQ